MTDSVVTDATNDQVLTMDSSENIRTVAVSGPTGLVGTALCEALRQEGKDVVGISRQQSGSYQDTIRWDPATGLANPGRLESVDAVIHLAGANIADGRWTAGRKSRIRNSRVEGTRSLVESIKTVENRPRLLICASAIGYYGSRDAEVMTEDSEPGEGFLADVCRDWEGEADAAAALGLRVVKVRIGVVMSPRGGALKTMLTPFKLGLGGVVGSGEQYCSWIGLHDLTRVFQFCLNNPEVEGPVNAVGPEPQTNTHFTKCLGNVLGRPTIIPLPAFMVRLIFGEMGDALLLSSTRVAPKKLQDMGFEFEHPTLEECLVHELNRT